MMIRGPGVTDQPTVDIHRAIPALFGGAKQWGFPSGSAGKESACNAGDLGSIPGLGRPLEKEMTTHSSILAWKILWTEEPGGVQFGGCEESDTTE